MEKEYKYYFFDLDGTLTDSGLGIVNSVKYALKEYNKEIGNVDLYKFVGPPLKLSFKKYYFFKEDELDDVIKTYRIYFKENGMFENSVYSGVEETLDKLNKLGKNIYVVTSKPQEFAIKILQHFNLYKYFHKVYGASMDETLVEKKDIIRVAIKSENISNLQDVVMVGDRDQDINGARYNGIDSIGVTYGYGSVEELRDAKATYIINKIEEVIE